VSEKEFLMWTRCALTAVAVVVLGCGNSGHSSGEARMKDRPEDEVRMAATRPAGQATAATTSRPTDRPAGPGLPAGWEQVPTAAYTAVQQRGEVVIRAKGENPSAGYETKFMQSMLRIWPPQYVLIRKRPAGMAAQVVTPFEVTASFKAAEPVGQVVVRDGMGRHEVKVGGQ
jgi:hypothetical protein